MKIKRERLLEERIVVSRKSLYLLLKNYNETNYTAGQKRAPRRMQFTCSNEHF